MPETVGSYRLVARIDHGGTADVYAALDPLGQTRALKVQRRVSSSGLLSLAREFQIQSWLTHPALVRAYDVGVLSDGRGWLALEYIDGVSARDWVGRHSEDRVERTFAVIAQVAEALADLATRGLVHGDLKPSNLMVEPSAVVRVMDLGVARWTGAAWIPAGHFAGTAVYAAPEQLRGEPLTPAADVFSLAAVTYALIEGRSPFPPDHERDPEAPPPRRLEGVNPLLGEVLLGAFESSPELRPSAKDIATLARSLAPIANEPEPPEEPAPPSADGMLPSHEQLLALLSIAGAGLDTEIVARATDADPADILPLLTDLTEWDLVARRGPSWIAGKGPPERAPWNDALAEGLLGALDPEPSLARAHALLHLGRIEEAAEEAVRRGLPSERLRATGAASLVALWEAHRARLDVTLLAPHPSGAWLALDPSGDSSLARGFRAARRGDGEQARALAAAASREGADAASTALLRARALALQGRHSTAIHVLHGLLEVGPERLCRSLALVELAWLQSRVGRIQLARERLRLAREGLPERPPPALLGRWLRVAAQVDVELRRPLDPALLRETRRPLPAGGDARVLAALETLARVDESPSASRDEAVTVATAPGDDLPDLATAAALSIAIVGGLPELPDPLAVWLGRPGAERWQLELITAALALDLDPRLQTQAREAAAPMLSRWSEEDRFAFRLQPRWARDVLALPEGG